MASSAIQTLVFMISYSRFTISACGACELVGKQRQLAAGSIPVIAKLAKLADHAVTWDEHRNRVMSYGSPHGPHSVRAADAAGDLPIRCQVTGRDPQECLPNLD